MNYADKEGKLTNLELYIVHPGDSVRIVPAKSCIEPRVRPDGRGIFPGFTSETKACGGGTLYAMKNISVVGAGKYSSGCDGMIDMSGPGARECPRAQLVNLVIYGEEKDQSNMDGVADGNVSKNIRYASHLLAEYIGKTVVD